MDYKRSKDIAVIGMACRFPEADTLEEYWNVLISGQNTKLVPEYRRQLCGDGFRTTSTGNFLKSPIDLFDAGFFGMSPKEAEFTDPQARLALELSWEALEDSRINPDRLKGTQVGVYYGSWLQDYKELLNKNGCSNDDFMRKYLGNSFGCTSAKLSFFYKFIGENIATESGCSSSMVAVTLACKSLREKKIDLAMVAGSNIILQMDNSQKGLWAEDGKCKSFDSSARGYGRGEGAAVLVLKRLDDATRDGDRIHGVILGEAVCQEGLSKSFGAPTVEREVQCMRTALEMSRLNPNDVDYIEAHATGTAAGDPVEAEAICRVYKSNSRQSPLLIASGKTNIGHCESSSGLAGIIKVLLAMKYEVLPKHIFSSKLNPKIKFDTIPGEIPVENTSWQRSQTRERVAGVSSFGITGTCAHIIIKEPPFEILTGDNDELIHVSRGSNLLPFSAQSLLALEQLKREYMSFITPSNIGQVCYTASTSRSHDLGYRQAIVLSETMAVRELQGTGASYRKLCFTFAGVVGSMDFSPARRLYSLCYSFRNEMNSCNLIWKSGTQLNTSLIDCLNRQWTVAETKPWLWYATAFAIQYSLAKVWMSWGIVPDMVLGHCMGEMCAAVVSGRMAILDAFKILQVSEYFEKSDEARSGQMLVLQCDIQTCEAVIDVARKFSVDPIEVALVNATCQTVIATSIEAVPIVENICTSKGIKFQHIKNMQYAVHSRFVEEACMAAEKDIFQNVKYSPANIPHVSSFSGDFLTDKLLFSEAETFWYKMFRNHVQFSTACESAARYGCDVYLEIGLGSTLTKLTLENLQEYENKLCVASFQKSNTEIDLTMATAELYVNGLNINWESYYAQTSPALRKIDLPHYPFQRESFWFKRKRSGTSKLLGNLVSRSSNSEIYQVDIDYSSFPYMYDHLIHDQVIFPAAGYLEMVAGAFYINTNNSVISIENFKIHRPLALDKGNVTQLQTHSIRNEGESWQLQVFSKVTSGSEWTLNASCTASICNDVLPMVPAISASATNIVDSFYRNMKRMGLKFGPSFRSLDVLNKSSNETLGSVQTPLDIADYAIHPILLDAMIQCSMAHTVDNFHDLQLPVEIRKICINTKNCQQFPLAVSITCQEAGGETCVTMTSKGHAIASMEGLKLVRTNLNTVMNATTGFIKPEIYEIHWKQVKSEITANLDADREKWILFHDLQEEEVLNEIVSKSTRFTLIPVSIQKILRIGRVEELLHKTHIKGIVYLSEKSEVDGPPNSKQTLYPLLLLAQVVLRKRLVENFHLVTTGCTAGLLWGFMRTYRMEHPGLLSKSIEIDMTGDHLSWVDQICQEMQMVDNETEVVYSQGNRFCRRLQKRTGPMNTFMPNQHFSINYPETKLISDVNLVPTECTDPGNGEVTVEVKFCSLNFKDVLSVITPGAAMESMKRLGCDYSGVISKLGYGVKSQWKVGDSVFGFECNADNVTSIVTVHQDKLTRLPRNVTYSEGAALPTVFLTAWHCIMNVAGMTAGKRILIHAACGGVGIAAIKICKHLGVEILCTAGSSKKRSFLRSLGIQHVYHSRSTEFCSKIRQDLADSQPVHMVLNSLTGPGFKEASLQLVKDECYFVEISKLDIWSEKEFAQIRPLVNYHIVDVMKLDQNTYANGMTTLVTWLEESIMKPLPCSIYPVKEIVPALQFLQKAKHIGKVFLQMPETGKYSLFNGDSTYFISGGTGALGLEIANWMVAQQGAKYIVLAGRSTVSEQAKKRISEIEERTNAKIIFVQVDVSDFSQVKNLLSTISCDKELPPLRGIHHCAGSLSDKLIVNQTWDDFEQVMDGKVRGGWNLHQATIEIELSLEFFVMHSSMCATFGNVGQSNYTAANTYLDSLAILREKKGLPGLSINWGKWDTGIGKNVKTPTLKEFSCDEGIQMLEKMMLSERTTSGQRILVAGSFNDKELLKLAPYYRNSLLNDDKYFETNELEENGKFQEETNWKGISPESRSTRIYNLVKQAVCETLGIDSNKLKDDITFRKMGMDSLMGIEFTNRLVISTGLNTIAAVSIEEFTTVKHVCEIVETKLME